MSNPSITIRLNGDESSIDGNRTERYGWAQSPIIVELDDFDAPDVQARAKDYSARYANTNAIGFAIERFASLDVDKPHCLRGRGQTAYYKQQLLRPIPNARISYELPLQCLSCAYYATCAKTLLKLVEYRVFNGLAVVLSRNLGGIEIDTGTVRKSTTRCYEAPFGPR